MVRSLFVLLFFLGFPGMWLVAQQRGFRFAHITDTHIGSPNGTAEEDLRRTVTDVNRQKDSIAFAVITGDITELGRRQELLLAKQILDSLQVPWYIIPGNHDVGWSESGGQDFVTIFGYDKFSFDYGGIRFLGCGSGPYVRMSDGHIPRDAVLWLDSTLNQLPGQQPLVFFNHYPLDSSLDNWYEATDRLRRHQVLYVGGGHWHANVKVQYEGMPGVIGRSNLRARESEGGYNLVQISDTGLVYAERKPLSLTEKTWHQLRFGPSLPSPASGWPRPDYCINNQYPSVKPTWIFSAPANVIGTPATDGKLVFFGDMNGTLHALDLQTGKSQWHFKTGGGIFASPAVDRGVVTVGSADGFIYAWQASNGKLLWKQGTRMAVLGSPLIVGDTLFIGGSDSIFRAMNLRTGALYWQYTGLRGPVVSKPGTGAGGKLYTGAWDTRLHALDRATGQAVWTWNNGSPIANYSPASCTPLEKDGVVYVVAPDRYLSAIDAHNGQTLWRSKAARVRESVGISEDGKWLVAKTMQDSLVVFATGGEPQQPEKFINLGYGYDHVPSMPVVAKGVAYVGTRNGVVYAAWLESGKTRWAHKLDNAMVNTVNLLDDQRMLVATMDGKVALLTW